MAMDRDDAVAGRGIVTAEEVVEEVAVRHRASSLHTLPKRRFYLTRRGKILQSTTERYLRDDLGYGTMLVPSSSSSSGGTGSRRRSTDTIAGKIAQLVPWTIEDAPSLRNTLVSASGVFDDRGKSGVLRLAVVDTNALLHHMDVLEFLREGGVTSGGGGGGGRRHLAIADAIVIPQTALEECRHRSLVMYRRATDLVRSSSGGEDGGGGGNRGRRCVIVFADAHHVDTQIETGTGSVARSGEDADGSSVTINDENDERLRKVALHYGRAFHGISCEQSGGDDACDVEVVFLSDDVRSRELALSEQPAAEDWGGGGLYYKARSMLDHVALLQKEDPTLNLLDMVAQFNAAPGAKTRPDGDGGAAENYYPPHVASSALSRGLQIGRYYQGTYRSNRDTYSEGYVTVRRGEDRVAVVVRGRELINRAVDGDVVAVELFGVESWLGGVDEGGERKEGAKGREEGGGDEAKPNGRGKSAGIAADTAEPSVRDIDNIAEEVPVDEEGLLRRPTGRVVGIIRRNFHKNYVGSICTVDANDGEGGDGDGADVHPHDAIAARHEREYPDGTTSTVVFFSIDARVPPVLLRTTQRDRLAGMRILVSMDSWPADSEYPLGHYVRTLGKAGTKDTETEVLLQEHRIPCEPFPAKVMANGISYTELL